MKEHDEKTIVRAKKWFNADLDVKVEQQRFDAAKDKLSEAIRHADTLKDELSGCVGSNIPRRCISMQNGNVVIIEYRKDHSNTVTVDELLL